MGEMELYSRLHTLSGSSAPLFVGDGRAQELALHKIWLQGIRRERPRQSIATIFPIIRNSFGIPSSSALPGN